MNPQPTQFALIQDRGRISLNNNKSSKEENALYKLCINYTRYEGISYDYIHIIQTNMLFLNPEPIHLPQDFGSLINQSILINNIKLLIEEQNIQIDPECFPLQNEELDLFLFSILISESGEEHINDVRSITDKNHLCMIDFFASHKHFSNFDLNDWWDTEHKFSGNKHWDELKKQINQHILEISYVDLGLKSIESITQDHITQQYQDMEQYMQEKLNITGDVNITVIKEEELE